MYLSIHTVDAVSAITKGKEATRPNNLTTYNMHESQSATNITSTTSSSNERMGGNTQQQKKTENVQGDEIEKNVVKPLKYENGIKAIANVCVCQYSIIYSRFDTILFVSRINVV